MVAAGWFAVGCGGSEPTSSPVTTTPTVTVITQTETMRYVTPTVPTSDGSGPPSLGCDAGPECLLQWATDALTNCPENALPTTGKHARRRLQRLVAQIKEADNTASIDGHNALMGPMTSLCASARNRCRKGRARLTTATTGST